MSVRTINWILFIALSTVLPVQACTLSASPRLLEINLALTLPDDIDSKSVGEVLYTQQGSLSDLTGQASSLGCVEADSAAPLTVAIASNLTGQEVALSTWQTSVPGLGARVTIIDKSNGQTAETRYTPFNITKILMPGSSWNSDQIQVKIDIIKTGTLPQQELMSWQQPALLHITAPEQDIDSQVKLTVNATLPPPRCNFSSPTAVVNLEPVSLQSLRNNHASNKTPWTLSYICSRKPAMASLTVTGDMWDTSQGIFKPRSGDNQAQDIGLQIWFGEQIMISGQAFSLDSLTPASGGLYQVPLGFNYILAGPQPRAGDVSMTVTMKLNYL